MIQLIDTDRYVEQHVFTRIISNSCEEHSPPPLLPPPPWLRIYARKSPIQIAAVGPISELEPVDSPYWVMSRI